MFKRKTDPTIETERLIDWQDDIYEDYLKSLDVSNVIKADGLYEKYMRINNVVNRRLEVNNG